MNTETPAQFEAYRAIGHAASAATRCADAGVALVTEYTPEGSRYVMWAADATSDSGALTTHRLDCAATSQERLIAHLAGFVANHRAAWAARSAQA